MQFRHMVIGLDFKSLSLNAAAFALRRLRPQRVTLAHVIERQSDEDAATWREDDARVRLLEMAEALGVPQASVRVTTGLVGERLLRTALDAGADLLCIGEPSHGAAASFDLAAAAKARMSVLRVPRYPTAACVHAIWQGVAPGELLLGVASAMADAWGENVNALCYLTERDSATSAMDGGEQRQLAHILHHAQVAGVRAVHVDAMRNRESVVRSLVSFVEAFGNGLLVVDGVIAQLLVVDDARCTESDDVAIQRLLERCPLLAVAPSLRPQLLTPGRSPSALLAGLLSALPSQQSLAGIVPRVLPILERDPLACGGHFPGDLLRALMEIGGTYWVKHEHDYARYRAVLRRAALERRGNSRVEHSAFWTELPAR